MTDRGDGDLPARDGTWRIEPAASPFVGEYQPPSDRIMTHLGLILGSLTVGTTYLLGALESPDTVATRRVLAHLGVSFTCDEEGWLAISRHQDTLIQPQVELDCGESDLALRLLTGLLCGQKFSSVLSAEGGLALRPLNELVARLKQMGAQIECLGGPGLPPIRLKGQPLYPVEMQLDADSPEARDPLLLAAMNAVGTCKFIEVAPGPDHAERMLRHLGVGVRRSGLSLSMKGEQRLYPKRIKIPGDFTAAAPLIVAATLVPGSELTIVQVGTNPGRAGLLKTLSRIGGIVERQRTWQFGAEPVASFSVRHTPALAAFNVAPNLAQSLLDELPLIALLATQASGTSHIRGIGALRRGIPDCLQLTTQILRSLGADVELEADGVRITGPTPLAGAEVQCANDPRLVMLAATAAMVASAPCVLHGADAMLNYYPSFFSDLSGAQAA